MLAKTLDMLVEVALCDRCCRFQVNDQYSAGERQGVANKTMRDVAKGSRGERRGSAPAARERRGRSGPAAELRSRLESVVEATENEFEAPLPPRD